MPYAKHPMSLYHESLPPVVAHNPAEEADYRKQGYSEEYKHHEYPKATKHTTVDGQDHLTGVQHEAPAAAEPEEKEPA